jgi:hypothetical protein
MPKRPPSGRCVHCLDTFEELTWDHVFPLGWYPDGTPENLEKWKIPSCLPCNHLHSKNEGELLVRMGLCVDPEDPLAAGIAEKAMRATRASEGRDERDAQRRAALRKKILASVIEGEKIPHQATYPGFGPYRDQPIEEQVAVPIKAKSIRMLAEKVVRGLIYIADGRFVEAPYEFNQFVLNEEGAAPIKTALDRFGQTYERGPGIRVRRASPVEDPKSAFYEVEIWGKLKMYASVLNTEREMSSRSDK